MTQETCPNCMTYPDVCFPNNLIFCIWFPSTVPRWGKSPPRGVCVVGIPEYHSKTSSVIIYNTGVSIKTGCSWLPEEKSTWQGQTPYHLVQGGGCVSTHLICMFSSDRIFNVSRTGNGAVPNESEFTATTGMPLVVAAQKYSVTTGGGDKRIFDDSVFSTCSNNMFLIPCFGIPLQVRGKR